MKWFNSGRACPGDGVLRAYSDCQLTGPKQESVERHLQACPDCAARLITISHGRDEAAQLLAAPVEPALDAMYAPVPAYDRFREKSADRLAKTAPAKRRPVFWNGPVWGGAAAAAALVLVLSFVPAQTLGQRFLRLLRVQKLTVVPVNLSPDGALGNREAGRFLTQAISDNVVVTMEPSKGVEAASPATAGELAGFKVKTLEAAGPLTKTIVNGEGAFHLTLDRDRMQAILDQAGRSDIHIPDSVNGSTVAVHIPKAVRMSYGSCDENQRGPSCLLFMQVPAPAVSVPPALDMPALAEAALQVAGMSAAEAHTFTRSVDWTSTIVIPIPQGESSYRSVAVDGVIGTLIEFGPADKSHGGYALMWLKNGIIYGLEGHGSGSEALAAASSLGSAD